MTVGRFNIDWDWRYNFYTLGISDLGTWSWITDWGNYDGLLIVRPFGLGTFQMYVAREADGGAMGTDTPSTQPWHFGAMVDLQLTEQIGVDLGVQHLHGDDATEIGTVWIDSVNTIFGGLRYNFNQNIGVRGILYHQRFRGDRGGPGLWAADDYTSQAYKLILDVSQDFLGFSSLWLGFDVMEAGFLATGGGNGGFEHVDGVRPWAPTRFDHDMRTFRVGATQQWNDQWRSWLYFAHHTFRNVECPISSGEFINPSGTQWGVGVEYMLNSNVGFALNFVRTNFDDATDTWMGESRARDDHLIRFRTQITF